MKLLSSDTGNRSLTLANRGGSAVIEFPTFDEPKRFLEGILCVLLFALRIIMLPVVRVRTTYLDCEPDQAHVGLDGVAVLRLVESESNGADNNHPMGSGFSGPLTRNPSGYCRPLPQGSMKRIAMSPKSRQMKAWECVIAGS